MLLIFIDFLKKTPIEINFIKIFLRNIPLNMETADVVGPNNHYVYKQHLLKDALKNI